MALQGVPELKAALSRVAADADEVAKLSVQRTAAQVETNAKANFSGSHGKGEPHTGGDKPNVVTGTARRSIRADPIERTGLAGYTLTLGPRVLYYRRLELGWPSSDGGVGHAVTRAFPSFGPAAAEAPELLRTNAEAQWAKFLRK